tara:strand:- start:5837 stop:6562 length:726 start_codon:yes stop_codon:yes gene_type:complete
MKKICFYLIVTSQIFAQTTIDTLSVTIYPEFSYPGVAVEYKFDKFGSNAIEFPISSDIDSVLYTVSEDGLEFEQILQTKENSLQAINQDGNHTIYLFLDRFIKDPGPRKFSYDFESNQTIKTFILGVQIPFASEDFTVNAEGFSLERVRDQNGLTFFQGIINDFSESSSSEINLSYYNPHGNTSIEYAANISTQDSAVQPPPTASDRFVRYPFITWEPMIAFLLLSIILVSIYEFQRTKDE